MWAVGWQGAQDVKRSERPRPDSAGAAAHNHAPTYDMKPLTLNGPLDRALDAGHRWRIATTPLLDIRALNAIGGRFGCHAAAI